ncbi:hypothetical protein PAJ_0997 [Pantoea ananatis AJ13355]|uniref:Uncharacterized protein n=1 Tax=Pantoea ananatis (strain AJ13355) TaxID=932677 RepID=A0A0H3L2R3_PANAA|nr:hypothetical protein PAJ_0997 [Pantoea ananatis AJ13355]
MRFDKQTRNAHGHTGTGQLCHLSTAPARGGTKRIAGLQRVRHVENDRRIIGHLLHHVETQHIHNQVVIAEVTAAIAENDFVIAAFGKLIHDIAHLAGADKLRLLDVNHRAGFCHCFDQIGLTRQESRQLNHIHDVGNRLGLGCFVNVGNDFHAKRLLQRLKNLHALFQAGTTVRVN